MYVLEYSLFRKCRPGGLTVARTGNVYMVMCQHRLGSIPSQGTSFTGSGSFGKKRRLWSAYGVGDDMDNGTFNTDGMLVRTDSRPFAVPGEFTGTEVRIFSAGCRWRGGRELRQSDKGSSKHVW